MRTHITDADLGRLNPDEKGRALADLVEAAKRPANGMVGKLSGRIQSFEERFKMSSQAMADGLASGELRECDEFGQWKFLLALRDNLVSKSTRRR